MEYVRYQSMEYRVRVIMSMEYRVCIIGYGV